MRTHFDYFDEKLTFIFVPFIFIFALAFFVLALKNHKEFKKSSKSLVYLLIGSFIALFIWTIYASFYFEAKTNIISDIFCKALPDVIQVDLFARDCK